MTATQQELYQVLQKIKLLILEAKQIYNVDEFQMQELIMLTAYTFSATIRKNNSLDGIDKPYFQLKGDSE